MTSKFILGGIFLSTVVGSAVPVVPTYTTFGPLPQATFNPNGANTGNPNDPVAVRSIADGGNIITLGLAAQQRYGNPSLGNNGAGTYFATPGLNDGLDGGGHSIAATWNFDFYVNVAGGGNLSNYKFVLRYDFDPTAPIGGPDSGTLGLIDISAIAAASLPANALTAQDSQNLYFGFLTTGVPGAVIPPSPHGTFDPNALGQYTFSLEAYSAGGALLGISAINVNVNSVPDGGSTIALLGLALGGLTFAYRRLRA